VGKTVPETLVAVLCNFQVNTSSFPVGFSLCLESCQRYWV